jgi:hypothetical protein
MRNHAGGNSKSEVRLGTVYDGRWWLHRAYRRRRWRGVFTTYRYLPRLLENENLITRYGLILEGEHKLL